jgi:hypothetical protein
MSEAGSIPMSVKGMRRRRDGAEVQCSVSQAAATSFPASSTAPTMVMGQKVPAKIAVGPLMEKHTQAGARATTKQRA